MKRQGEAAKQAPSAQQQPGPRILQRRDIDVPDDLETAWRASYLELQKTLTGSTQQDHNVLQVKVGRWQKIFFSLTQSILQVLKQSIYIGCRKCWTAYRGCSRFAFWHPREQYASRKCESPKIFIYFCWLRYFISICDTYLWLCEMVSACVCLNWNGWFWTSTTNCLNLRRNNCSGCLLSSWSSRWQMLIHSLPQWWGTLSVVMYQARTLTSSLPFWGF